MVAVKRPRKTGSSDARPTARRKPARPYHHGDLRRALTEGALALVAEVGPQAFTLRELARRIGVSHAAPYRHFADKRALVTALAIEGGTALHDGIAHAMRGAGDDPRAQFLAAGYAYVRFAIDHPALFTVMFSTDIAHDDPALARSRERSLGLLFGFIAKAQASGAMIAGPVEQLAQPVWAMHHGLACLALAGRYDGWSEEQIRASVDYAHASLLDGLLVRSTVLDSANASENARSTVRD